MFACSQSSKSSSSDCNPPPPPPAHSSYLHNRVPVAWTCTVRCSASLLIMYSLFIGSLPFAIQLLFIGNYCWNHAWGLLCLNFTLTWLYMADEIQTTIIPYPWLPITNLYVIRWLNSTEHKFCFNGYRYRASRRGEISSHISKLI